MAERSPEGNRLEKARQAEGSTLARAETVIALHSALSALWAILVREGASIFKIRSTVG